MAGRPRKLVGAAVREELEPRSFCRDGWRTRQTSPNRLRSHQNEFAFLSKKVVSAGVRRRNIGETWTLIAGSTRCTNQPAERAYGETIIQLPGPRRRFFADNEDDETSLQ